MKNGNHIGTDRDIRGIPDYLERARRARWTTLSTALLATIGCGDPPSGPDDLDPDVETVALTPSGGTSILFDGAVQLDVPPGALSADTEITVALAPILGLEGAVEGAVFDFQPDGLEFASPVEVRIDFDPAALGAAIEATDLRLHEYTTGAAEVSPGSRVIVGESVVVGSISGFSVHGVGEASDASLEASIDALWEEFVSDDTTEEARQAAGDAMLADIYSLYPRLSRACEATNRIPDIGGLLVRLAQLQEKAQLAGGSDFFADSCGGILDEEATVVVIEPDSVVLGVGDVVTLDATVLGPPGMSRELVGGQLEWLGSDPGVATVDQAGRAEGVGVGDASVSAGVIVVPGVLGIVTTGETAADLKVLGPIELEVMPAGEVVLAAQQWTVFDAVVRDSLSGEPVDGVEATWEAVDPAVVDISLGAGPDGIPVPNGRKVEGRRPGSTDVQGCAEFGTSTKCQNIAVRVVWNLNGTWAFEETLTTTLDPPESETCTINGTVTLTQNGESYLGTTNENVNCVYDPGDGSEPEVIAFQTTGVITNGLVVGNRYSHRVTLSGEQCTSQGVLSADLPNGTGDFATGTTDCVDEDGFVSSGPSTGEWREGTRHTRLGSGGE